MVIGPGIYVIAFQVRVVCGAASPIEPLASIDQTGADAKEDG
jgi:hypothetical protein